MSTLVRWALPVVVGVCVAVAPGVASAQKVPMRAAKRAAMVQLHAKVASVRDDFQVMSYRLQPCESRSDGSVGCEYRIVVNPGYPPLPGVDAPPPLATCAGFFLVTYTSTSPPRLAVAIEGHGCL